MLDYQNNYSYDLLNKITFNKINDMINDGFVIIDTECKITYINKPFCDFLRKSKPEVIGKSIKDIISNSELPNTLINKTHDIGIVHEFLETDTNNADKKLLWVSRLPIFDEYGKVIAAIGQVKFELQTTEFSNAFTDLDNKLKFYKNELASIDNQRYSFDKLIGISPSFIESKKAALSAANNDFSVLITGETGTGKKIYANTIHYESIKGKHPLISINCADIPTELLESELFGYKENSYLKSDNIYGNIGKYELANNSTLFIDEIDCMPLNTQEKLLQVLQEKEIENTGAYKLKTSNVRIISATRHDLGLMVKQGKFKQNLYYRLNLININIPPLRNRKQDIRLFVADFLRQLNNRFKSHVNITQDAMICLINHNWNANIRELKNVVESAYSLVENHTIDLPQLPQHIVAKSKIETNISNDKDLGSIMDSYEKQIILKFLKKNNFNGTKTSKELGIHRSSLYKKIKKLGINLEEIKKKS